MSRRWALIRRSVNYYMHEEALLQSGELKRRELQDRRLERSQAKGQVRVLRWIRATLKSEIMGKSNEARMCEDENRAHMLWEMVADLNAQAAENNIHLGNAVREKNLITDDIQRMEQDIADMDLNRVQDRRDTLLARIRQMLGNFHPNRYVKFMEIADFKALRILSELGGELMFTVGRSVTLSQLDFLTPLARRFGIAGLSADRLYHLSNGQVITLTDAEALRRARFRPRAPRA